MTRPLGREQLRMLCMLASPTCLLVTPGRVSRALTRAGLLREENHGPSLPGSPIRTGGVGITAAGLRRLADEMEAGRVADAMEHWRVDVDSRRQRRAQDGEKADA